MSPPAQLRAYRNESIGVPYWICVHSSFIRITEGQTHKVKVLADPIIEPGDYYLLHRGYSDFGRVLAIDQHKLSSSPPPSAILGSSAGIRNRWIATTQTYNVTKFRQQ